jgi:hypothetical protein
MVPGKGFVLLARLSALCRAMWTIRRCVRSSWVKCRVPKFLLKAATDDPGGAPPMSWKRYPSRQAYLQPHICRQWVSTAGPARGGRGSRQPRHNRVRAAPPQRLGRRRVPPAIRRAPGALRRVSPAVRRVPLSRRRARTLPDPGAATGAGAMVCVSTGISSHWGSCQE